MKMIINSRGTTIYTSHCIRQISKMVELRKLCCEQISACIDDSFSWSELQTLKFRLSVYESTDSKQSASTTVQDCQLAHFSTNLTYRGDFNSSFFLLNYSYRHPFCYEVDKNRMRLLTIINFMLVIGLSAVSNQLPNLHVQFFFVCIRYYYAYRSTLCIIHPILI